MSLILTHPAFMAAALLLCSVLGGIIGFVLRGWLEDDRRFPPPTDGDLHGRSTERSPGSSGRGVGGPWGAQPPMATAREVEAPLLAAGAAGHDGFEGMWEGAGPLVLLVDDRLEILAIHSSYLHQHGYGVLTAGDGETALEYARTHRPAVMVLDHSMPHRTGLEVARELKRDPATRDIAIVMMTAHSYGAVGAAAKAAGCESFLTKPVEPSRMLREVAALAPVPHLR